MSLSFNSFQRSAVSVVGALFLATVFVGTAVAPAEAAVVVAPAR